MPQMAPLSWLTLFLFFFIIFILFNILNYYIFLNTPPSKKINKIENLPLNWKW